MAVIVEHLTKQYAGQRVVDHLDFELRKGEITGFLGLNGAGKTTTMKMMCGALLPDEGDVRVFGHSILLEREQAQQHLGYLPEHNPLYPDMYVKEYLSYVANIYHAPWKNIAESIALTRLESHAHKKIHTLSKGYRQRVGLAATLLHDPDVLILDEPTTGLHFEDVKILMDAINRLVDLGNSFIIIEHNLDVIKLADHIIDIGPEGGKNGGQIVGEGTPEQIIKNKKSITGKFLAKEMKQ